MEWQDFLTLFSYMGCRSESTWPYLSIWWNIFFCTVWRRRHLKFGACLSYLLWLATLITYASLMATCTWVYLCMSKQCLSHYQDITDADCYHFGRPIKSVYFGGVKEYLLSETCDLMFSHVTFPQESCPRTPKQNGANEMKHHYFLRLLAHSSSLLLCTVSFDLKLSLPSLSWGYT